MNPPSSCDLSIIIVSWNVCGLLRACLSSLPASLSPSASPTSHLLPHVSRLPPPETIVIDNASTDGSADMVANDFPGVRLIRNTENIGFGRANNQGIVLAQGHYILLLNSDTLLPPGVLAQLVDFMETHPQAGACSPRLLLPDGRPQPYAFGGDPSLGYLLRRGVNRLLFKRPLHDWAATTSQPVDWVSGACLLLRREALQQTGGFDEAFFMYFEDVDLCLRLRQAGWQVWHHPAVGITHIGGQSLKQNPAAQAAYQQSLRHFYRKHYSLPAQWLLTLALAAYNALSSR